MKYQTVYDKSWIEKNVQPGQQLHFGHTKYLMVFGIKQVLNLYQNKKKSQSCIKFTTVLLTLTTICIKSMVLIGNFPSSFVKIIFAVW